MNDTTQTETLARLTGNDPRRLGIAVRNLVALNIVQGLSPIALDVIANRTTLSAVLADAEHDDHEAACVALGRAMEQLVEHTHAELARMIGAGGANLTRYAERKAADAVFMGAIQATDWLTEQAPRFGAGYTMLPVLRRLVIAAVTWSMCVHVNDELDQVRAALEELGA